ncbi:hypothetical protein BGP_4071 [Beggiatoa sp. PS]|nr:hypothetical protein BGP_4071 [Beggiatoa sp. PS]
MNTILEPSFVQTINESRQKEISRRQMLKYAAVSPLLLTPLATPTHASVSHLWLMTLHPVRFVGGLVFNFAAALLIELLAEFTAACMIGPSCIFLEPPANEPNFQHSSYKRGIVHLGLCDAVAHQQRELAIKLISDEQHQRFDELHKYLMDKRIRVKLATDSYSHSITINTPVDDLFMLDYFLIDEQDKLRHYENLIAKTGVDVFDQWHG